MTKAASPVPAETVIAMIRDILAMTNIGGMYQPMRDGLQLLADTPPEELADVLSGHLMTYGNK